MLEIKNVTKTFPGVKALDEVSLTFNYGEIHALLGENGAGKSTLIKVITGTYIKDGGEVFLDGKKVEFKHLSQSIAAGISLVPQEIQAIPDDSIAENILLDKMKLYTQNGFVQWKKIYAEAQTYMDMVGLKLSPKTKMRNLSAAQKQLTQIAKALSTQAKVLILDEPTSALTLSEADNLFELLYKLRDEGKAIIFVSHKLEEVLKLCDKFSVLRDGKYIGTKDCAGATQQDIISMMIGRVTNDEFYGFLDIKDEVVLECKDICQTGGFENLNLQLRKGEILGLYGLVGSGRTELARIIIGEDPKSSGEIYVNGEKANIRSTSDALNKYKIGYVSENRKEEGLLLRDTVRTNIVITSWKKMSHGFLKILKPKEERELSEKMIQQLAVKTPSQDQIVGNLSGGNQQKICFARWVGAGCDILIIDEPTVGVDVGAKESIHRQIWQFAKEMDMSIILISSDMPELIKLSRRILVFRDFKIAGEIDGLNETEHPSSEVAAEIGKYITV